MAGNPGHGSVVGHSVVGSHSFPRDTCGWQLSVEIHFMELVGIGNCIYTLAACETGGGGKCE
jgi:hypothetical protein